MVHPLRTWRSVLAAVAAVLLAVVLLSFVLPAIIAVFPAFGSARGAGVPAGTSAAGSSFVRLLPALRFTLTEALLSAAVAVLVGLPSAFLAARRDFPGRRFLLSLSGVPLCIPPVIIALAFVLFYGRQGYLNVFLMAVFGLSAPPVTFLYSLAGVVIAHGFYNFPVVLRTVSQVWERLPEEEEDAALLLGAGRFRIFRTITMPRLTGAILASAVLVFLYCFFSFVIVLLFGGIGGTTLEVELYQAARTTLDFHAAGIIALAETVAALCVVVLYVRILRRMSAGTAGTGPLRPRKRIRGAGERIAIFLYLGFLLVFFIGPLASIVVRSFVSPGNGIYTGGLHVTLDAWKTFFGRSGFFLSFWNTVAVALATSLLSTSAALFFALAAERFSASKTARGPFHSLFRIIPLAPLAVSTVMLGFGWTLLVPRGNIAVLVCAQSAIAWPFAWTQIRTGLDRIPRTVHEAAALLSPDPLDAPFRVLVPLVRRGILSGAGFVFAISAGDATLPLVLSLGRFVNLPLTLYRLAGAYRFSEACVCAVFLGLLTGTVFFLQDGDGRSSDGRDGARRMEGGAVPRTGARTKNLKGINSRLPARRK